MSKVLLIQPPQWYPVSPYLAVPLLLGQLKNSGIEAKAVDLNIDFFNSLLCKKSVSRAENQAKNILNELSTEFEYTNLSELEKSGMYEQKTRCLKYLTIKKFYDTYSDEVDDIVNKIDWAVNITRKKDEFFCPEKLFEAKHIIKMALKIVSLPYAPNEIDFDNYYFNPLVNLDWENVKGQCEDKTLNMFSDFLSDFSEKMSDDEFDLILISMTDLSQIIPTFTLAKMLKERTKSKVALGGNYATQIHKEIMKFDEIFKSYFDYLIIGDGEIAVCKLCEFIAGKCKVFDIPNLVYHNGKSVISTGFSCEKIEMDELAYADFGDFDMRKYFTPDSTFPIQLSKGCYWGKCSFCDYAYGQQGYSPKNIQRIIDELKHYIDKYNASKFMFVDEAIPPKFYNELALAIIKNNLKINFYSFARLEKGYTPEVLSNLYNAGARLFLWGYECKSPRIMKIMNKGIDIEKREQILSDARNAGIWNNGLFIFGYPTETMEEIEETMDFIRENRRIVPSCTLSNFSLKKNSLLIKKIGENGVVNYTSGGEFYIVYKDVVDGVSQNDRRTLRRNFQFDFLEENANALWPVIFSDFDHLLLYLSKYGCDYVNEYRSNKRICPEFR